MAHVKAIAVIFEQAVELQGLRDVYANMLQGERLIVHMGNIHGWQQESVVQKHFSETFPKILW